MKLLSLVLSLLLLASPLLAADLSSPASLTNTIIVRIENNDDVSAFNFRITGAPILNVLNIGDINKEVVFNPVNGNILVYGYNNDLVAEGNLLEITLDAGLGDTILTLSNTDGATPDALPATVNILGNGIISITFDMAEIDQTAKAVIGLLPPDGLDVTGDGSVTILDVQTKANYPSGS